MVDDRRVDGSGSGRELTSFTLLLLLRSRYPMENILIHEMGHTVMNVGLREEVQRRIHGCYERARDTGMYSKGDGVDC